MKKKIQQKPRAAAVPLLTHRLEMLQAIGHAENAHWEAADAVCRQIIRANPSHFDAINLLGVVAIKRGDFHLAIQMLQKVTQLAPQHLDAQINLGMVFRELGEFAKAEHHCRKALEINPESAAAFSNLGNALQGLQRFDEAVAAYERAIRINPQYFDAVNNLVIARRAAAVSRPASPMQAVRAPGLFATEGPSVTELRSQADAAIQAGDDAKARALLEQLLIAEPDNADIHCNLSSMALNAEQFDAALQHARKAVQLCPTLAEAHNNAGLALCALGRPAEAESCYDHAMALRPDFAEAMANLAIACREQGDLARSAALLKQAIRVKPDYADAHYELGHVLLQLGDFAEGWKEFEWRRRVAKNRLAALPEPLWQGEAFDGKTLLIHAEQGLGDSIQFVRYLPAVKARGGRVVLRCYPALLGLFAKLPGADEIVSTDQDIPAADLHVSLFSLPRFFSRDLRSIPTETPYLTVDPVRFDHWRSRLSATDGLRVGLVWAGNPEHANDRRRSIRLADLTPLATVPNLAFFSLQKGPAAADAALPPAGMQLTALGDELNDLTDTAAVLANLDLLISVDTSVAHLAGALGKPVWTLIGEPSDWRWLKDRSDSPWYPSMRLFRQTLAGDWRNPIDHVRQHLQELARTQIRAIETPPIVTENSMTEVNDTAAAGPAVDRSTIFKTMADMLPAGARVFFTGIDEVDRFEQSLPFGAKVVEQGLPHLGLVPSPGITHICIADPVDRSPDASALLRGLRGCERPVLVSVEGAEESELTTEDGAWAEHFGLAGFAISAIIPIPADTVAMPGPRSSHVCRLAPEGQPTPQQPRVLVLLTDDMDREHDAIGLALLQQILPVEAILTILELDQLDGHSGAYDLVVVGTGGSLRVADLPDSLFAALDLAPRALGVFGISEREAVDLDKLDRLLDRLFLWCARHREDTLLYGRNRANCIHFGDWAINGQALTEDAYPNRPARTPTELMRDLNRSPQASYEISAGCPESAYRSLLIDLFNRHLPPKTPFTIDRPALARYRQRCRILSDELRQALQRVLVNS